MFTRGYAQQVDCKANTMQTMQKKSVGNPRFFPGIPRPEPPSTTPRYPTFGPKGGAVDPEVHAMRVCPLLRSSLGHIGRIRVVASDQGEISEAHFAVRGDACRGCVVGFEGHR